MAFRNFNQNAIPTPSHSGTKKKKKRNSYFISPFYINCNNVFYYIVSM